LDKISEPFRNHPDALEIRWSIRAKSGDWTGALQTAQTLMASAPKRSFGWIHAAFSLHELGRTPEAYELLLPTTARFPGEWVIRYNLACYSCQMGKMDEAMEWFEKARVIGDPAQLAAMALEDPDLASLRSRIQGENPGGQALA
jgi:tetratricopeptide (TPR) repeat protein